MASAMEMSTRVEMAPPCTVPPGLRWPLPARSLTTARPSPASDSSAPTSSLNPSSSMPGFCPAVGRPKPAGPALPAARGFLAAEEGGRGGEGHGADHQGARGGERREHEERRRAEGGEARDEEAGRGYGEPDEAVRPADEREAGEPQGP